jgi:hypothetical protein
MSQPTLFEEALDQGVDGVVAEAADELNRIAHGENVGLGIGSIRTWAPSARALSLEIIKTVKA